jgi:hypothetical protein
VYTRRMPLAPTAVVIWSKRALRKVVFIVTAMVYPFEYSMSSDSMNPLGFL